MVTTSEVINEVVDEVRNFLLLIGFLLTVRILLLLFIFIDSSDDGLGSIFRFLDLNEGVLVTNSFLTDFTEIEVLADAALVSHTNDWCASATITGYIEVLD